MSKPFQDDIYVSTPEQVRKGLYDLIATTGEWNINENVDFLYNLLTQQGVTL